MRVLVVGGAGYVGCVLVRTLVERGYQVRVLDRMYFGDRGIHDLRGEIELIVEDMRTVPRSALLGVDAVINVGGLSNDPTAEYNPRANDEMNTQATVALARLCVECRIPRYILASSCSIYDRGFGLDAFDALQDETSEIYPRSAYPRSKFAAEREILRLTSQRFYVTALRKATLFGPSPRMRYDLVVNTFVKDALSQRRLTLHQGGEMWRPLADVRDAAEAYVALVEADPALINGQVFNLVAQNLRVVEIARSVQAAVAELGVAVAIRSETAPGVVRSYRVSGEKLRRVLGFAPTRTVENSVREMVAEIRQLGLTDFDNPLYYNIRWMELLDERHRTAQPSESVFDIPSPATRAMLAAAV